VHWIKTVLHQNIHVSSHVADVTGDFFIFFVLFTNPTIVYVGRFLNLEDSTSQPFQLLARTYLVIRPVTQPIAQPLPTPTVFSVSPETMK
jgi:hypothetical protein